MLLALMELTNQTKTKPKQKNTFQVLVTSVKKIKLGRIMSDWGM